MNGLRREGRGSRPPAVRESSLALLYGSSFVTGGGGLVAQVTGHAGTMGLLGIYGSAGLIAVVGGATAIVKILAERSPEIRKADALAEIAKKQADHDGGTLLLLDRCIDKEGSDTSQVLQALNTLVTRGCGATDDTSRRPMCDETSQSSISIHVSDKGVSASSPSDLLHSRLREARHFYTAEAAPVRPHRGDSMKRLSFRLDTAGSPNSNAEVTIWLVPVSIVGAHVSISGSHASTGMALKIEPANGHHCVATCVNPSPEDLAA